MSLAACTAVLGQSTLLDGAPDVHVYHDVLFDPASKALYDRARRLIISAAYLRGTPQFQFIHGSPFVSRLDPDMVEQDLFEGTHIFLGVLHHQYGHFLVNTLSRFWALGDHQSPDTRLFFINGDPAPDFDERYKRICFETFGLRLEDFARLTKPTRLRRVIVPGSSFEENNLVYRVYGRMMHGLGDNVVGSEPIERASRPAYITRTRLPSASSRLDNEGAVADFLAARGVDVISPETLNFEDQVRIWRSYTTLAGCASSAMHTSVMSEPINLLVMNYAAVINSNQLLVDRVNGNRSVHMYPASGITHEGSGGGIGNIHRLVDPLGVAADLMRGIERLERGLGATVRLPQPVRRADSTLRDAPLIEANLATGRPARQSSISGWSRNGDIAADAAGALSGYLTGTYQFHTDTELQPWWEVDLRGTCDIRLVRIYNRCDLTGFRANRLELLARSDRSDWVVVYRKDDDRHFGGISGTPLVCELAFPARARHLRIRLLREQPLHLDQVEIIGDRLDDLD